MYQCLKIRILSKLYLDSILKEDAIVVDKEGIFLNFLITDFRKIYAHIRCDIYAISLFFDELLSNSEEDTQVLVASVICDVFR